MCIHILRREGKTVLRPFKKSMRLGYPGDGLPMQQRTSPRSCSLLSLSIVHPKSHGLLLPRSSGAHLSTLAQAWVASAQQLRSTLEHARTSMCCFFAAVQVFT